MPVITAVVQDIIQNIVVSPFDSGTGSGSPPSFTLLSAPSFSATTGRLDAGSWYDDRTSAATFINSDSMVQTMPAETLVYNGARVVENIADDPNDFEGAAWLDGSLTFTTGQTDPDGGTYATRLTATGANAYLLQNVTVTDGLSRDYCNSIWVRAVTVTGEIQLYKPNSTAAANRVDISGSLTTSWQRFSTASAAKDDTEARLGVVIENSADVIEVCFSQLQDKTNRSDPTIPDEYESSIGYYNTENGNTVASNVVTEAVGTALTTQPVLRHAPAATNLIFYSTPSSTNWTFRGSCTGTNVEEGHVLGATCQVRSLGAAAVDDFYRQQSGSSNSTRHEISFWMKAITSSGNISVDNSTGAANGAWVIDMSQVSTTNFDLINRNHPAVTVTTEFVSSGTGSCGFHFKKSTGTTYDFDLLGCQLEEGTVSTPSIATSGSAVSRTIDENLHPYSTDVFDVDEGSLYMEIELPIDTDDIPTSAAFNWLKLATNNQPLYNETTASQLKSNDGTTAISNTHTNITAGTRIKFRLNWSVTDNEYENAIDTDWSTTTAFDGFTASLIELMENCPIPVEIHDFEVVNIRLTQAEHEARWP